MGKNDLKRDKRFRKHLEQEFQVDTPPASYFQAVQNALDQLPDELPVKARPLHQRMLRTCVALAACLVLVVGAAYSVNLVNPALMESMPGVGQIFQELNHRDEEKNPSPTPEVESNISKEESLPEIPAFEPVGFPLDNNLGMLTVSNASCDGTILSLDLTLEMWDSSNSDYINATTDEAAGETPTYPVQINGQEVQPFNTTYESLFNRQDSAVYSTTWYFQLPQKESHGTELDVSLSIPTLYEWIDGHSYPVDCQIYGDFQVTVDESASFYWEENVTDNGVELNRVDVNSHYTIAQLEIPFFGWWGSTLTLPLSVHYQGEQGLPLGCYPQLTTEDGTVLQTYPNSLPPDMALFDFSSYDGNGPCSGAVAFEAPPEGTSKLILTLYEYYPDMVSSGLFPSHVSIEENPQKNRVTAEFTIDLEEGRVYTSQNYVTQGRQKLDYRFSPSLNRAPSWENGYISGGISDIDGPLAVLFYVQDSDYRPVELRFYQDGQLVSSFNSVAPGSSSIYEGTNPLRGLGYYQDDRYGYGEFSLESSEEYASPIYGDAAKGIAFEIYEIDSTVLDQPNCHFELVDSVTGEVLISDVEGSYQQNIDRVYGGQPSSTYSNTEAAENQEWTASSWESSLADQASPAPADSQ